ncbi:MAG: hypothetical protein FJ290_12370, partial [Planctomycetes bacterium]|nr:hypothetical protein [Planctomycetota bacterium]
MNVTGTLHLLMAAGVALGAEAPWTSKDQPDLAALVAKAEPLKVEELGVPVTSVRRGELMLVPNPDGKTYDFLQWYFKGYGGPTTVFIGDLATGVVKKDGIPDRRQIHICGRVLGPDGKLYIATPDWQKGMEVYVYNPATNALSCKGVVAPGLAGETRPMCVGTDGMIYGSGSYDKERKAGAYQIDPRTGKVTDYGPVGPSHAPNGCWGYSVAADDRYIYVASGKVPWFLVAYDRQTGKDETLVTTENVEGMVSVHQGRHGCTASASKVVGTDGKAIQYWLYQGKAIPKKAPNEKPPWPEPADSKPWVTLPPQPEFFTESATPTSDGRAIIWHRMPKARGGDDEWKAIPLQVPTYPMVINRLTELPDGRILGTAD